MTIKIKREMTITHAEFFRLIPRALSSFDYQVNSEKSAIQVNHPTGDIHIKLSNESIRSLGALRLTVTHVEIEFASFSREEVNNFLFNFDLCYQKGGG